MDHDLSLAEAISRAMPEPSLEPGDCPTVVCEVCGGEVQPKVRYGWNRQGNKCPECLGLHPFKAQDSITSRFPMGGIWLTPGVWRFLGGPRMSIECFLRLLERHGREVVEKSADPEIPWMFDSTTSVAIEGQVGLRFETSRSRGNTVVYRCEEPVEVDAKEERRYPQVSRQDVVAALRVLNDRLLQLWNFTWDTRSDDPSPEKIRLGGAGLELLAAVVDEGGEFSRGDSAHRIVDRILEDIDWVGRVP